MSISLRSALLGRLDCKGVEEVCLEKRETLSLKDRRCGDEILNLEGILWITQTGDPEDYTLRRGERFVINRPGKVVLQGLSPARFRLLAARS